MSDDSKAVRERLSEKGCQYVVDKIVDAVTKTLADRETGLRSATQSAIKERTLQCWRIVRTLILDLDYSAIHAGDELESCLRAELLGIEWKASKRAAWSANG